MKETYKTVALNILFIPHNTNTINLAYKSKYNCKRENQIVLLMITNAEQWRYIALKGVRTDVDLIVPEEVCLDYLKE